MNIVFQAHSGFRWLLLLMMVIILVKSVSGMLAKSEYSRIDNVLSSAVVGLLDLQLLLGFFLYFAYSPFTKNFTFNMGDTSERFWSVEHLLLMILAITVAHIGKVKIRKLEIDKAKFKTQIFFFSLSLVLMIIGIPWDRVG